MKALQVFAGPPIPGQKSIVEKGIPMTHSREEKASIGGVDSKTGEGFSRKQVAWSFVRCFREGVG